MKNLLENVQLSYDGDLLKTVVFKRGSEVRPLWSKLERLSPDEMIFWIDRFDSLCSVSSEWALAQAAEEACGAIVSRRGQFVRTVLNEINRLLWLTTYLGRVIASLGNESLEQQVLILREQVFSMQEELTGGRILPAVLCVGGSRREFALGDAQKIRQFIQGWKFSWEKWLGLIEPDGLLKRRLEGLMPISKETVKKYGWWGIVGKAAGVPYDSRKLRPHGAYPFIEFILPNQNTGDALARFQVACQEVSLSLNIVDQLLNLIPGALEPKPQRPVFKPGIYFGTAESAKGPVLAAVEANHQDQIVSLKLFTGGQRVWPFLESFFKGIRAEDFELALASLGVDPEEAEA